MTDTPDPATGALAPTPTAPKETAMFVRLLARLGLRTRRVGGLRFVSAGRWTLSISRRRAGLDPPKPAAASGRKRAGKAAAVPAPLWVVTPEPRPDAPSVATVPDAGGGNRGGNTR